MLFTARFKNPSFMDNFKYKNLKFKFMVDDMIIDFLLS